jgi:hypothetical protein
VERSGVEGPAFAFTFFPNHKSTAPRPSAFYADGRETTTLNRNVLYQGTIGRSRIRSLQKNAHGGARSVRARFQSCRKRNKECWASAPEGCFSYFPKSQMLCAPCMTVSAFVKCVFSIRAQSFPRVAGTGSRAPYFGVHLDP